MDQWKGQMQLSGSVSGWISFIYLRDTVCKMSPRDVSILQSTEFCFKCLIEATVGTMGQTTRVSG